MKKERNARKDLIDLYIYLDNSLSNYWGDKINEKTMERYLKVKDKFDKIYADRLFYPLEWNEYYGLFKLREGKIGIDPKRMQKMLSNPFTQSQMNKMSMRNTTYFYPRYKNYLDYAVNNFVTVINELKKEFNDIYVPIINRTIDDIEKERKQYTPGDISLFNRGIYDYEEASMSANLATIRNNLSVNDKIANTYITLLTNFYHNMASRIEAVSVLIYSKNNPDMKRWTRDKLYDNRNLKNLSSRNLPSFKYHDRLYLIWNFIKHNNIDTYKNLKKDYPEVLVNKKYNSGRPAKYYLKLDKKLIIELLNGVENYFKEWCELNLNEKYSEAQWNYERFFINLVSDTIENIDNPEGMEF